VASAENIAKKQKIVEGLSEIFESSGVYLIDYRGLTVKEMEELRNKIRNLDSNLKVIKNRLAIKYFEKNKSDIGREVFNGPIAIAYSKEKFVEVAKAIVEFEKESKKIEIKKGFVENKLVERDDIISISKLPSRDQLMAQLAFSIAMPLKKFGMSLSAPLRNMLILLKNLKDKKEKGGKE